MELKLMHQFSQNRWAVVLAGGDGSRLKSFTKRIVGRELPKQFCPIMGPKPLLQQTLERISGTVAPNRTVISLNRAHQRFYCPILLKRPWQLAQQPLNRGTAPAILHALMRIHDEDPSSVVGLFPSDHYVNDDCGFMRHVAEAFGAAEARKETVVLLGVEARGPEQGYGWIEPGEPLASGGRKLFSVKRFVEKPDAAEAEALWRSGALWNTFVLVGHVSTLLRMFMSALPRLYGHFSRRLPSLDSAFEPTTMARLYAELPTLCFSKDVLQKCAADLAVLPVRGIEWCDLGEPARVMETIRQAGVSPQWAPR
jgi:mannose-1-phosphate guanylyltransferase